MDIPPIFLAHGEISILSPGDEEEEEETSFFSLARILRI